MKALWQKYRQLITFCLIGGMNTAVDFAVYSLVLILSGTQGAIPLFIAQAAGLAAGVANSFLMNRAFTFRQESRAGKAGGQLARFLVVSAAALLFRQGALWLLTEYGNVNEFLAMIPVMPLTMAVNFFGFKMFVFKGKEP
jgi:putative flippase GtrA